MSWEIVLPIAVFLLPSNKPAKRVAEGGEGKRPNRRNKFDSICLRQCLFIGGGWCAPAAAAFLTLDYAINCHLHIVIDSERRRKLSINWIRWNERRRRLCTFSGCSVPQPPSASLLCHENSAKNFGIHLMIWLRHARCVENVKHKLTDWNCDART